jgi:hypothetical protein
LEVYDYIKEKYYGWKNCNKSWIRNW